MTIPFVQAMTSLGDDFNREFNEYLESINYDYQEILDSIDRRMNETIKKSCNWSEPQIVHINKKSVR